MAEHPIQGLMNVTMEKIRQMVDSNTIIGKPITTEDGITILPVSKVSFGFASGGTDFDGKNPANKDLFGGGSGAGVNIQPVAFLVIKDGCVRTIQLSDTSNTVDRALTMLPELVDKIASDPNHVGRTLVICHCNCKERAEKVKEQILAKCQVGDILVVGAGGITTVYANDGGVVVAY